VVATWVAVGGWIAPIESADLGVAGPDGSSIQWSTWLEDHGPSAVVLWASWIPDADATLKEMSGIVDTAASRELDAVLISVQESHDEARAAIGTRDFPWLNDRYGGLLKDLRVVKIPALVIVAQDGTVLARLDATSQALRDWKNE